MTRPVRQRFPTALLAPVAVLAFVVTQGGVLGLSVHGQAQRPAVRVAFVYHGNIWILDEPGGRRIRLTSDGRDSAPRWIAGGRALLFERQMPGRIEILRWQPGQSISRVRDGLWSPDGTAVATTRAAGCAGSATTVWVTRQGRTVRITPIQPGFRWDPAAWSPDSRRLALARFAVPSGTKPCYAIPSGSASLWLTVGAIGATHLKRLPMPSGWPDIVFWSPAGRFLTVGFGPNQACNSCRADGRPYAAIPVAGGKVVRLGTALSPDEAISWAPDGSFVVLSGPFGRAIYQNKQLVGVNPITGARRALSHDGRWADVEPAVSPDGKQIAFARGRSGLSTRLTPVQLIASRRLIVMDADGTHPHRLTAAPGWTDEAPVWSPDGQSLLFVRWRRHRQGQAAEATLWAVRADGTDAQRLAQLDLPGGFLNGFGYYGAFGWRGLFAVAPS